MAADPERTNSVPVLSILFAKRWWLVAATALCATAAYGLATLRDPVYSGTAQVIVQPPESVYVENVYNPNGRDRVIETELELVESFEVEKAVQKALGYVPPRIATRAIPQTDLIEITARAGTPAKAAQEATGWARAYISVRRAQARAAVTESIAEVKTKISELDGQISALDANIETLRATQPGAELSGLQFQRNKLVEAQSAFQTKASQLEVDSSISSGGVQLVTPAHESNSPVEPRPARSGVLGGLLGLLGASGIIVLTDAMNRTVRSKEDAESALDGLPVLGVIPRVESWRRETEAHVVVLEDPRSAAAEAFRSLRTSVQFLGMNGQTRSILVTSANPAEGKSSVAANLAVALSQTGRSVLVVDCDLRLARAHQYLAVDEEVALRRGLSSVIDGVDDIAVCTQRIAPRLDLLPAGPRPTNPAELLGSPRLDQLVDWMKNTYEHVIFDCPPILPVTDAAVMAAHAEMVLLVCEVGHTDQRDLARAAELLRQVNAPVAGSVLNAAGGAQSYGAYSYSYRYTSRGRTGPLARFTRPKRDEAA